MRERDVHFEKSSNYWKYNRLGLSYYYLIYYIFKYGLLGAVRVLSRIANLASKCDGSNPCSYRDMTFFVIFSKNFQNDFFFQNLKFFNL